MKLKKRVSILLILAMMLSFGLAGCGGDSGSGGGSDSDNGGSADADTVNVGVNYELTGKTASYGTSSRDGILMAFDEINAAGGIDGKQIKAIETDNKSDPAEVTSLATRLITKDKVVAVLGPATTGCFKAQEPIATKNQVPMLSGSATADDVTVDANGVKEYVFRICFSDSYQGNAMAKYAADKLGAKTAAVVMDSSSDYAKGLNENFTKTFEANGGKVVATEAYVSGDKDFSGILTKIKGQKFDVIYLPGYYNDAGLIIKQARDLGIDAPILGADGFDSPTLLELAGADALNNIYFTNHYSAKDQDPAVQDFIKAFNEKYGKEPDAFNALGYDCGKFVADAIVRAGSLDPNKIKDAMASTKDFKGVTGTLSMDENHNPVKDITVIGLANGEQATAEKVQAN